MAIPIGQTDNELLRNVSRVVGDGTNVLAVSGTFSSGGTPSQLTTSQDLSAGSLDYTTAVGDNFLLKSVYLTFTSSVTQTVQIKIGNAVIDTIDMTGQSYVYLEELKVYGGSGEEVTVTCTNTGTPAITASLVINIEVV